MVALLGEKPGAMAGLMAVVHWHWELVPGEIEMGLVYGVVVAAGKSEVLGAPSATGPNTPQ